MSPAELCTLNQGRCELPSWSVSFVRLRRANDFAVLDESAHYQRWTDVIRQSSPARPDLASVIAITARSRAGVRSAGFGETRLHFTGSCRPLRLPPR